MGQVYGIYRGDNGACFYIGATRGSAEERFRQHLAASRCGYHHNIHFQNIVRKLGESRVWMRVLSDTGESDTFDTERLLIQEAEASGQPLVNRYHKDGRRPPMRPRRRRTEGLRERVTSALGGLHQGRLLPGVPQDTRHLFAEALAGMLKTIEAIESQTESS